MAIARVTTWNAGDVLTAAALNAEYNNILNNATSLISPLTAALDGGGQSITNVNTLTTTGDATFGALIIAGTVGYTITTSAGLLDTVRLSVGIRSPIFCLTGIGPNATTNYYSPAAVTSTTESGLQAFMPYKGTLKNLRVVSSGGAGAVATTTVFVRVAAANTTITCVLAIGETSKSDTTHTAAVAALQAVTVSIQSAANESALTYFLSFEYELDAS